MQGEDQAFRDLLLACYLFAYIQLFLFIHALIVFMKTISSTHPLGFLIGKWISEGEVQETDTMPAIKIFGTDQYEWILDGLFILHRVDIWIGDKKVEVLELIGEYDEQENTYMFRSFDNSGQSAAMTASIKNEALFTTGQDTRSVLNYDRSGHTMQASWEQLDISQQWKPWMIMHFRKA